MTTYDEVWETFISKCKTDDINLPTSEPAIYRTIQNAILEFNVRLEDDLSGDDENEILDREISGNHLLILAHLIRKSVLENQLIYFSTTFIPFTKDIGVKNVGNQIIRLENLIEREDHHIDSIILKTEDSFYEGLY